MQFLLAELRLPAAVRVDDGWTALDIALWADHDHVVAVLAQHGQSWWHSLLSLLMQVLRRVTCRRKRALWKCGRAAAAIGFAPCAKRASHETSQPCERMDCEMAMGGVAGEVWARQRHSTCRQAP